jgi:hypothetical protein
MAFCQSGITLIRQGSSLEKALVGNVVIVPRGYTAKERCSNPTLLLSLHLKTQIRSIGRARMSGGKGEK